MTKIAYLAGGTGGYTGGRSLSHIDSLRLTMIVPSTDEGGSSRRLMDENHMPLPAGDAAQALMALATRQDGLLEMMPLRLEDSSEGANHSVANLLIAAKTQDLGNTFEAYKQALVEVGEILGVRGTVLPVSRRTRLAIERADGSVTVGEDLIDEQRDRKKHGSLPPIRRVFHDPEVTIDEAAAEAIAEADAVLIGPGSTVTSADTILVTQGVAAALSASQADIVVVANLANERNHTDGWTAHDYARHFEQLIAPARIKVLLANIGRPDPEVLARYEAEDQEFVELGEPAADATYTTVSADMLASTVVKQSAKDAVARSLLRHDTYLLQAEVIKIMRALGRY